MKSSKCSACGLVSWSDGVSCKRCGADLTQKPYTIENNLPDEAIYEPTQNQPKQGLAIFALVLGIIGFFTLGIIGIGAVIGIIAAIVVLMRTKRDPWQYGGRGLAIAALVLNIMSLVSVVPVGIIAAIAIPNLLAARVAANEASAIRAMQTISSAESFYFANYNRYATLPELANLQLIDPTLATGHKNGYRFDIDFGATPAESGFDAYALPMTYPQTGRRAFYVDETGIIRGADKHGLSVCNERDPVITTEYLNSHSGPLDRQRSGY